ncbi:uncharacterized protein LOC132919505 isoform X1 [Rhopalosiphum padi]|uniref:uncharacterized protein LOC132919505 isoform X1 n=1 Tax=Rhopalosiphum padi TaxID=40932 RepID=UPI00298DDB14|nr:uncharacterized protein LOC132919505 isoform X1 [Rhopalosiphum padi]
MWNGITIGYSSADETINFGTRAVAIGDSRIFETTTLATIKRTCDEKCVSKEDLKISAMCTHDLMYISGGRSFTSFNTSVTEINQTFGFPNEIVDAKISDDGCYLIVLLYDWTIYCCSFTNPRILFIKRVSKNPRCLPSEMESPVGLFFSHKENQFYITVITSSGFINKFICANVMELMEKSVLDNDFKNIENLITLKTFDIHENVKTVCGMYDNILIAGDSICLYEGENMRSKEFLFPDNCKIKKLVFTQDKSFIICLTDSKTMLLVCAFSFLPVKEWNKVPISDFTVMEEMGITSVLLLTDEIQPSLMLVSMPDFSVTFKLPTSSLTYLIDYPCTSDGLLYLEALGDEDINTLHVKLISEGQPDLRLARMLRRGKYDEARNFAAAFNLDPETVYKEQVKGLMGKLDVWQPGNKGIQETFDEMMDYLNKIKDDTFVGNCALNIIVPSFTLCRKLLRYALLRVKSSSQGLENKLTFLLDQLQSTLHKLDTFCLLHDVSDWSIENTELWLSFCKQNVNDICLDLVQKNQLSDALTVWSRHIAEIKSCINDEFINEYFSSTPFSVDIYDLKLWVKSFASTTLFMYYDETVASMVSYIESKVRWNELYLHLDWINPSLEICRYFLNIINQIVSSPLCLSISRPTEPQMKLILLIKYITELKELNDNFGVKITLDDYELSHEDQNYSELSFLILDQIQMNTFSDFITTFWSTFTLQRFLNSDEILAAYIKNIVSQVDCWWSWEEKATMILNFISNKETKCDSALSILKAASIPWSELMVKLCDETLHTDLNTATIKDIVEVKSLLTSKLILKSYNLSFTNITPSIIIIAVQNICSQNRSTVLEDIIKLVSTQSVTVQREAYEIYIQYLIESGFTDKAIESLTNPQIIPSSMVQRICITIWITYNSLRKHSIFVEEASKYFIVLKFLAKSQCIDIRQECQHSVNGLVNIYCLKNEFKIECDLSEFSNEEKLIKKCVNSILKDECFNNMKTSIIQAKLSRLSNLLFQSFENVVVQFVKESALQMNNENICIFGQFINSFGDVSPQLATKLLELGELLVSTYDPVFQAAFKIPLWTLIRRITQLVTVNSESSLLTRAVELSQWVEPFYLTCGDVVNSDNIELGLAYSWRNGIIDKNSIHIEFFEQFKLYSSFLNFYNPKSSLHCYKKIDVKDSYDTIPTPDIIMSSLEYFQGQNLIGLHITVTQIMCLYRAILQNQQTLESELTKKGNNLIKSNVRQILKSVTYSRNLDMDLGLGLLNTLRPHDAFNWLEDALNNVGMNYQKLTNITDLGLVYLRLNIDTAGDLYETLKSTKNKCIWGKKLMKYGFAFKDAFYNSELDQRHLLQKMIRSPIITLNVLVDYCNDTHFDLQQTAKLFLESCLIQWEPYTPGENEEKTFDWIAKIIEDKDALLKKCEDIFCVITDKTDILDFLWNHVWEQVNIYYYEVFLVIMGLIEKYDVNAILKFHVQKEILLFLMQYKRVSLPEEHEQEIWFAMFQESQSLPPISKYRLPYVPLANKKKKKFGHREIHVWKIIKPELTFFTYNKWFSIIEAIEMDKDTLCILTVKNMVNEVATKDKNVEWYLHMRLESLLKDIQEVLSNVKNLEIVAASLYFVVNSLPLGADQLAAAKISHSQAQEWVKLENSENAKSGITKVVTKYVLITTKHILHMYGFGKPNYLQLALQPNELIRELYNDPIILKRHTGEIKLFPDINGAVDAIVEVHGKGDLALKVDLLKEWLQPSTLGSMGSPDKSLMSTTNSFCVAQENLTISEGVLRACYLLENDTPAYNLHNFLICQAYNEDDSDSMCPTSVRLRALQCLCLVTTENIEEITCRSKEMMKNNLVELSIITELETLGINFSPARYRGCDKSKLVQSLMARRSLSSTKLASHLCVLYSDAMNPSIWDLLLTRLIHFTMINELEKVLIHLMDKWHKLTFDIVEKAWNVFLKSSFNSAKDSYEVIHCVKLAFSCPVIDSIDLQSIIEHCERFQLDQYVQKLKCLS